MRKRYFISAGIMAAAICLALAILAALPPRPGVTKANSYRIEEGMRLNEVEAIFGGLPDGVCPPHPDPERQLLIWDDSDGSHALVYFSDSAVTRVRWLGETETITQKLRRWLHL